VNFSSTGPVSTGVQSTCGLARSPRWDKNSTTFNIYHDIEGNGDAIGPRLAQELVCDGDFPVDDPVAGIYVYRDTGASPKGDLQVYDRYYETAGDSYLLLLGDQKGKYNDYHGQDDLFLLSWTLTPIPTTPAGETVLKLSAEPNQKLASAITEFPTAVNKQVNLVYINYVDTARATDVCLYLNGAPHAD
jgi:hypothetical protein